MGREYASAAYACQSYALATLDNMFPQHETLFMETNLALGKAIARLRREAKLSQAQLGEPADVDQSGVSRIERGLQELPNPKLAAIAKTLGVSVSRIWAVAEDIGGGISAPAATVTKLPAGTPSTREIDSLRYAVGAVAIAIAKLRPDVGERIVDELRRVPEQHQTERGVVSELSAILEEVAAEAKAAKRRRRPPRS
jgi:transcriptional regulator with XRE-family HTH domain